MEKETFKLKPLLQQVNKSPNPLLIFDLATLVEKMKHEQEWENGNINAMVLLKTPNKQIVLTTLHSGTEIESFQSNDSITFQIIEGKIAFHTRNESIDIEKDQILTLHDNIKYSLKTKDEAVLLITIASSILQLSVN